MSWYVFSSGIDPEKPQQLTKEQIVQLISQGRIGKNAKVMSTSDTTRTWHDITETEFSSVFDQKAAQAKQEKAQAKQEKAQAKIAEKEHREKLRQANIKKMQESTAAKLEKEKDEVYFDRKNINHNSNQNKRYPNLIKYLGWGTNLTNLLVGICAVISGVGHSMYFFSQLSILNQSAEELGRVEVNFLLSMQAAAPMQMAICVTSLLLSLFLLFIARLCILASLEFVQVVLDIEQSNRDTKRSLQRIEVNS